jgi:hypothetical protein
MKTTDFREVEESSAFLMVLYHLMHEPNQQVFYKNANPLQKMQDIFERVLRRVRNGSEKAANN